MMILWAAFWQSTDCINYALPKQRNTPMLLSFSTAGRKLLIPLEERLLIPSPKVATYDLQPEMSAYKVTEALLGELDKDKFDVIILNFANPDMVGHTGILSAAVKAIEAVDTCVGKIVPKVLSLGGTVCITADHGNSEKLQEADGTPCTSHTTNPVPFHRCQQRKACCACRQVGRYCAHYAGVAPY
jgi:2,3-bisphosphoglycerate-independent phosphoglycerate mutase